MAAVTVCSDFGAQENKVSHCFHCLPIYLPWSDGTGCHDLCFLNVEFSASFFILFHLHQEALLFPLRFLPWGWCHLHIWSLLIFLPAVLIQASASSSLAFCMMFSAYKLNKQGDNIQPWRTPYPVWNQSVVPCPVITVPSCPAYRFLRRQVRWSVITTSWRIFHSLLWSTQSKALA